MHVEVKQRNKVDDFTQDNEMVQTQEEDEVLTWWNGTDQMETASSL